MPMRIAIALVKFAALTVWIGFVAMWAENIFRMSASEQFRMVEECKYQAGKKYQDDVSGWSEHYVSDAGFKEVAVNPRDKFETTRMCMFKHDQTFMGIF